MIKIPNKPKAIDATIGYKLMLDDKVILYVGDDCNDFGDSSYIYKDEDAYKSGNGVCYISELELTEYERNIKNAYNLTDEEFDKYRDELHNNIGITRNDILKECYNNEKYADMIFSLLHWQYLSTLLMDIENNIEDWLDDIIACGFTKKEIKKYFNYILD